MTNTDRNWEKIKGLFRDLRKKGWTCKLNQAVTYADEIKGEPYTKFSDLYRNLTGDFAFTTQQFYMEKKEHFAFFVRATTLEQMETLRDACEDWGIDIKELKYNGYVDAITVVCQDYEKNNSYRHAYS